MSSSAEAHEVYCKTDSLAAVTKALEARFGEPRLHLHSREIVIPISRNKDPVRVVAPAPVHLQERLRVCGWNGE